MNPVIAEFLNPHKVDGLHTHVSMISPMGKFQLNKTNQEKFWDIYCNNIFNATQENEIFMAGIAEKPQYYLPILVDIDIKKKEEDFKEDIPDKLYTDQHLITTIEVYQSVLRNIIEDCNDKHLTCIVLEKPLYKTNKNGQKYIKNGFHLHFPYTFISKADHEVQLLPRVKQRIEQLKLYTSLGIDNIDNIIDKSYTRVPWLLYGSRKSVDSGTYTVTTAFNSDCEQVSIEEALRDYKIFDNKEREICFKKDVKYYLPRILSIIPYGRNVCEIKNDVGFILQPAKITPNFNKKYANKSVQENLKISQKLLEIISDDRVDSYNDWMTIGWTMYNISNGCQEGLNLWMEFSQRSPKFKESICLYEWSKMIKKDITIGTLKHYAKKDNPKEYEKIIKDQIKPHIENSLNGSHNDIAKALLVKYGEEFKCGSIDYKRWYRYRNNFWNKIEDGRDLRMKISEEIHDEYKVIGKEISDKLMEANDEGERAMYTTRYKQVLKLMSNLKSAPFKGHVMKEAKDLFYEQNFTSKLDSDPWIVGCQNGIYDLKINRFREGIPNDYVSMKLGVKYNDQLTDTDPMVQEVYDFLEKVFPDRSVREYFLDTSSDVFVGGNPNKLVQVWSGEGDNAKSVTQTLFEKMMGDYSIKLPTSLIVGKRTQSSAACPELVRAGNGVRWAVLQEPDAKDVINIGILKELSGNDTFFARGLYKEGSEITPMFKLALICNEPPKLPYSDKATWNRIRVIPFEATFCDDAPETLEEQMREKRFPKDPHFSSKIPAMTEAFFWVLLNHRKNMKRRFEPEKVKMATAQYKKKNDIYRQFIDECTVEDDSANIRLVELYSQFKEWFRDSMPNHSLPIKNEVKEYFLKIWGEPGRGCQWNGYRIRTMQDDIDNEEETVVLDEEDLIEYDDNEENGIPNL